MAPTPRFKVGNLDQWGRLVKSWATGLDYINTRDKDHPPRSEQVNLTLPPLKKLLPETSTEQIDKVTKLPLAWCLPAPAAISISTSDGTAISLPFAVALTREEFRGRLGAAGVEIAELPEKLKFVVIVQGGGDTMVFRLPPKDTLQGSEDDLLNGDAYLMPDFYDHLYPAAPAGSPPAPFFPKVEPDRGPLMRLHAYRIGEYTLNNCS